MVEDGKCFGGISRVKGEGRGSADLTLSGLVRVDLVEIKGRSNSVDIWVWALVTAEGASVQSLQAGLCSVCAGRTDLGGREGRSRGHKSRRGMYWRV